MSNREIATDVNGLEIRVGDKLVALQDIGYFMGQDPESDKIEQYSIVTVDRIVDIDNVAVEEHADRYGPWPTHMLCRLKSTKQLEGATSLPIHYEALQKAHIYLIGQFPDHEVAEVIEVSGEDGVEMVATIKDKYGREGRVRCEYYDGQVGDPYWIDRLGVVDKVTNGDEEATIYLDNGEVVEINENAIVLHENEDHWRQSGTCSDPDYHYALLRKHLQHTLKPSIDVPCKIWVHVQKDGDDVVAVLGAFVDKADGQKEIEEHQHQLGLAPDGLWEDLIEVELKA